MVQPLLTMYCTAIWDCLLTNQTFLPFNSTTPVGYGGAGSSSTWNPRIPRPMMANRLRFSNKCFSTEGWAPMLRILLLGRPARSARYSPFATTEDENTGLERGTSFVTSSRPIIHINNCVGEHGWQKFGVTPVLDEHLEFAYVIPK